ncbi:MAG: sensor histidine kinase [Solirubrobacteraceae bacterium]
MITAAAGAAGVVVALVAFHGVRATTGVSAATAANEAAARGAMAAIPLAVALYAWRHRAQARFGTLLLGFNGVWCVSLLASSSSALVYSVGRVFGWIAVLLLACVMLAYPSGRLTTRLDRSLALAAAAIVAILYLPTALLVDRYPTPSPFASCDLHCPRNAFMVIRHEPAWIGGVLSPVRDVLVVGILIVVAARLGQKIRGANSLVRRTLAPLLAAAVGWLALMASTMIVRRIDPHSTTTHALAWLLAIAVPGVAVAFVIGIARWQVFVNAAAHRASAMLRRLPRPPDVQNALAEAFEDPGVKLGHWAHESRAWVATDGRLLEVPREGSGRWLTEVRDGDRRVAAIEHDAVLRDEPAFIDTAVSLARIAIEGERLTARSTEMLRELRASRARLLAAADSERRRIAQDLHDGAQQRLVALRIELEVAAAKAELDNAAEAATLREFGTEIEEALEDFRSMTRGIYPSVLSDRGLADALRSAALRSPIPTTIAVGELAEYPPEIATAVYFCCAEALQNVAKHAHGATRARITLGERNSTLRFSISDDGPGFNADEVRLGAGMINMRDRLSVVVGELTIRSSPGGGTRISGRIPLTAAMPAQAGPHGGTVRRSSRSRLSRDHAR